MTTSTPRPARVGAVAGAAAPRTRSRILPFPITSQELVLIGVTAALWVTLGFMTSSFLTPGSIQPLLTSVAPIALIGVGMTVVIITHNQAMTPIADRVITMKNGRVSRIEINEEPLSVEDIEW